MKKQQLNEVFRLQQLAGLKPINEFFFFDKDGEASEEPDASDAPSEQPKSYCYATFANSDTMVDADDRRVNIDPQALEDKGYKKLDFNSYEEFANSSFAKKNQGDLAWDFLTPKGKEYFDAYAKKEGLPFTVYVQDSLLERKK